MRFHTNNIFFEFMKTNSQEGVTLWLTGLRGAGKSTLATKLCSFLEDSEQIKCLNLDGDKVRTGLNSNLKFSKEDRAQNIRRIAQVAKLSNSEGLFVIVSCISPYTADRQNAKLIHQRENLPFYQVQIGADLETCEKRDPKGLYVMARSGKLPNFTGISDPYEAPTNPDLNISNSNETLEESFLKLLKFIQMKGHVRISNYQIYDYLNFEADTEELNILQTIQQGWSNVQTLMNYDQIMETVYFTTIKEKGKIYSNRCRYFSSVEKISTNSL